MKKVENTKKKKHSLKRWFKNINWTKFIAIVLTVVMLASFVATLVFYANAAK